MIIQSPTLEFVPSKHAVSKYIDLYNDGLPEREKLTGSHLQVCEKMLSMYSRKLTKAKTKFHETAPEMLLVNTEQAQVISTSNIALGSSLKRSPSTIYRWLRRLEKAGVVGKINHGKEANYEVLFASELLAFVAPYNPEYIYEKPSPERLLIKVQNAKCNVKEVTLKEHNINKIIPSESSLRSDISVDGKGTNMEFATANSSGNNNNNGNTGNMQNFGDKNTKKDRKPAANPSKRARKITIPGGSIAQNPYQNPALTSIEHRLQAEDRRKAKIVETPGQLQARISQEIKQLRFQYAAQVVFAYIDRLLPGADVWESNYNNAIYLVEKNFFNDLPDTKEALRGRSVFLLKAVELAGRYKDRTKGYLACFPGWYFDLANKENGFLKACIYAQDYVNKWEPKKDQVRQHKINSQKLQTRMLKLAKNLTFDNFIIQRDYVLEYIPSMRDAFFSSCYTRFPEFMETTKSTTKAA